MNIANVLPEYSVGMNFVMFSHTSKFLLIPGALATLFHFVV